MGLGDRVLIKPLHKVVRDIDGSIIPETGKNVILTPYHKRLARDKGIEICEAKVSKKTEPEKPAEPVAGKEETSEPVKKKTKKFLK